MKMVLDCALVGLGPPIAVIHLLYISRTCSYAMGSNGQGTTLLHNLQTSYQVGPPTAPTVGTGSKRVAHLKAASC